MENVIARQALMENVIAREALNQQSLSTVVVDFLDS